MHGHPFYFSWSPEGSLGGSKALPQTPPPSLPFSNNSSFLQQALCYIPHISPGSTLSSGSSGGASKWNWCEKTGKPCLISKFNPLFAEQALTLASGGIISFLNFQKLGQTALAQISLAAQAHQAYGHLVRLLIWSGKLYFTLTDFIKSCAQLRLKFKNLEQVLFL